MTADYLAEPVPLDLAQERLTQDEVERIRL